MVNLNKKFLLTIVIVLVVLSSLLISFSSPIMNFGKKIFARTPEWYAVHLTNGQVYFGQLKSVTPETITLKKIYFLESSQTQQGVFNLVKRSNRDTLMLTDDVFFINRSVVLFWEKLTPESEVIKGIKKAEEIK